MTSSQKSIQLPEPNYNGNITLEQALRRRRSVRNYTGESLKLEELSQLLWAGQGLTGGGGTRTSPSAGGLFPVQMYAVVDNVHNLGKGIYKYDGETHSIFPVGSGDKRSELAEAALRQECIMKCAVAIVITADISKTAWKYGERAERYVFMEAGHVSQNINLQATAIGLGTVAVGAFFDDSVKSVLKLSANLRPLYIMPVGRP